MKQAGAEQVRAEDNGDVVFLYKDSMYCLNTDSVPFVSFIGVAEFTDAVDNGALRPIIDEVNKTNVNLTIQLDEESNQIACAIGTCAQNCDDLIRFLPHLHNRYHMAVAELMNRYLTKTLHNM